MTEVARRWPRVALRWGVTLLVVLAVIRWVDLHSVATTLARLDGRFVALFFALSVPLYLVLASRWHFTASRLGAPLSFRRACLEYYVSTLLNQVLPFGVAGDVVRTVRHRDRLEDPSWGKPARAVILERFSGLVGLSVVVVLSNVVWLVRGDGVFARTLGAALVVLALGAIMMARRAFQATLLGPLANDARAALLDRGALGIQLAASLGAVAILLSMFACASRAVGVSLGVSAVVQVVPLVLFATSLPSMFGGLGLREGSTAVLFGLMGKAAADGVAVSLAFGVLSLAAATPGVIVLCLPDLRTDKKTG